MASPEGPLSNPYLYFQISMNKYRYYVNVGVERDTEIGENYLLRYYAAAIV